MSPLCSSTVAQEPVLEVNGQQARKVSGTRHYSICRKPTPFMECQSLVLQTKAFPTPVMSTCTQADIPTPDSTPCIHAALPMPAWTVARPGISRAQAQIVWWPSLQRCQSRTLRRVL